MTAIEVGAGAAHGTNAPVALRQSRSEGGGLGTTDPEVVGVVLGLVAVDVVVVNVDVAGPVVVGDGVGGVKTDGGGGGRGVQGTEPPQQT